MNNLTVVQNSIFEALRIIINEKGYWPNEPDFIDNLAGFEAAKQTIKDSGKELIQLFNVGNYRSKFELKANNVFLNDLNITSSLAGVDGKPEYIPNTTPENTYIKEETPNRVFDWNFEVRFVTVSSEYSGIIDQIISEVLAQNRYIELVDENSIGKGEYILVFFEGSSDISGKDFIEKVYNFSAIGVNVIGNTIIDPEFAGNTEIMTTQKIGKINLSY